ncbi:MAG: LysR substrate-binding domain-containing protein [Alphaproteobacteria bacterium]|nr:LysR substrate-binding domain-containing protein [Alphaproteobacteria bacterium]
MLSFRQIEAFRAVIVSRGITRAAEVLNVTQPAVSRLVRDMEAHLGLTLFRRRKGGLQPTEEALALYAEVERSFIGVEKIERAAQRIREQLGGNLRICGVAAMMHSFLPMVVEEFLRDHAGVAVALHSYDNEAAIDRIRTRQFDIGFVMTPVDRAGVVVGPVKRVRCVCVLPPSHKLARRKVINIGDLEGEPFISLADRTMTRMKIDAAFEAANVQRRLELEGHWSATICSLVERGLGLSIIEPFTAEAFAARGGIVRPFEPAIDFTFVQVRQSRAADPPLLAAFIDTFERCVAPWLI